MPVNIIDTLKPKNGLSFPVVEAIDVFVENYGNLADAISHFATDAMIAAINAVLSGKADSADLAALAAEVDTKADSSALTTAAANLQAQIDQLITPTTQDAEVQNARVDIYGSTHATLKARIESDFLDISAGVLHGTGASLPIEGWSEPYKYIDTSGTTVDITDIKTAESPFRYVILNCAEGDVFDVTASGGASPRAYCFIDDEGNSLLVADSGKSYTNELICAPHLSAKLIIQDKLEGKSYIGAGIYQEYHDTIDSTSSTFASASLGKKTLCEVKKNVWYAITNNTTAAMALYYDDGSSFAAVNKNQTIEILPDYDATLKCYYSATGDVVVKNIGIKELSANTKSNVQVVEHKVDDTINTVHILEQEVSPTWVKHGIFEYANEHISLYSSNNYDIWMIPVAPSTKVIKVWEPSWDSRTRCNVIATNAQLTAWTTADFNNKVVYYCEPEATSSAISLHSYTVVLPDTARFLYIVQGNSVNLIPPIVEGLNDTRVSEIKHSDFLTYMESLGLTITNDTVTFTTNIVNFRMSKNKMAMNGNLPYTVSIDYEYETSDSTKSPYITIKVGDKTLPPCYLYAKHNSFRVPVLRDSDDSIVISIAKPTAISNFVVKNFSVMPEYNLTKKEPFMGVSLNAHLGFILMYPENTMISFEKAIENGYQSIICNPKRTLDGYWVCCHDPSINRTATNADGTPISETVYISETNYADLLQYDFGNGEKIPLISDVLKMCAVRGVQVIYSIHECNDTLVVNELMPLTAKYGLLNKLIVKGYILTIDTICLAYGNKIMCYDFITSADGVSDVIDHIQSEEMYNSVTIMIDVPITGLNTNLVNLIVSNGYRCGAFDIGISKGVAAYKDLIDAGCTEFTDDANPHNGLDWM